MKVLTELQLEVLNELRDVAPRIQASRLSGPIGNWSILRSLEKKSFAVSIGTTRKKRWTITEAGLEELRKHIPDQPEGHRCRPEKATL